MALKATIFKAELNIADMDRQYYGDHQLTIAQHPSETHERMMLRLLVFALNATENLSFTKGISTDDEPDIWLKNLTNEIDLWIELGLPDEKRLRKACGRSKQVKLYNYGSRSSSIWWQQNCAKLTRLSNLDIFDVPDETLNQMGSLAVKSMKLQCTIQDGEIWINNDNESIHLNLYKRTLE